jgi:hypothetical protein
MHVDKPAAIRVHIATQRRSERRNKSNYDSCEKMAEKSISAREIPENFSLFRFLLVLNRMESRITSKASLPPNAKLDLLSEERKEEKNFSTSFAAAECFVNRQVCPESRRALDS